VRPERFVWAWPAEPPEQQGATPLLSPPAVDQQGRIYLHLNDRLVCLEEQNGKPEVCWDYVTGARVPGPVVVAPDGSLRFHAADGTLHGLSADGKQLWSPAVVGEPLGHAMPVVDAQGNTYVSRFEGGLHKVNADGRLTRPGPYFYSRQRFDCPGLIADGVLYIGSEDGYVFAIRLGESEGENLWDHAAGLATTDWYVHAGPVLRSDGVLIVASRDQHVYGFGPDGRMLWRTEMPGQLLGSPVLDEQGHIYLGVSLSQRGRAPEGCLISVDGNSHKVRWQSQAAGPVESTPVIGDDGIIYFGDNSGTIHAVDQRGKVQWTARVECAVRSALTIIAPGRLACGLDNETLVVLECGSQGLAPAGWPKLGRTLGQCGLVG